MKTSIAHRVGRLAALLVALSALGGCAVYEPAPAYYGDGGGIVYGGPSVYATPPVYVAPPSLYFGYRSRGWGSYHHGWHGRR